MPLQSWQAALVVAQSDGAALSSTTQLGAASTSNSIQTHMYQLESLN
jgi:hypothetical protein